jgi:hypothetical protein
MWRCALDYGSMSVPVAVGAIELEPASIRASGNLRRIPCEK